LLKVNDHVNPTVATMRDSLEGRATRVRGNGLGFDQTRLGSQADNTDPWVDPVVEVLVFFSLAILPVRGRGVDRRTGRSTDSERQRGWRKLPKGNDARRFHWPVWSQPLDAAGIDAILDVWNPAKRAAGPRVGVHAGWRSVQLRPRESADSTRAIGAEPL